MKNSNMIQSMLVFVFIASMPISVQAAIANGGVVKLFDSTYVDYLGSYSPEPNKIVFNVFDPSNPNTDIGHK